MKQELKTEAEVTLGVADLLGFGFAVLVLAIGLAYGLQVMGDVQDDMTSGSEEYNATQDGIEAVAKIPAKLGVIVTVFLASVIIGFLVRYLWKAIVE